MAKTKAHSSIALSLAWLRKTLDVNEWIIEITESIIPRCLNKHDLLGFCDILLLSKTTGQLIAIQAGWQNDRGTHIKKLLELETVKAWFLPNQFMEFISILGRFHRELWIVSWRKLKAIKLDGKKAKDEEWQPVLDKIYSYSELYSKLETLKQGDPK